MSCNTADPVGLEGPEGSKGPKGSLEDLVFLEGRSLNVIVLGIVSFKSACEWMAGKAVYLTKTRDNRFVKPQWLEK